MRRAALGALAAFALASCAAPGGPPPAETPAPPAGAPPGDPAGQRWWLTEAGEVLIEDDPYAVRPVRRADHDDFVTMLAPGVALVVLPAEGAPPTVSNMLAGALVRRFAGALRIKDALAAPRLFAIRPVIAQGDLGERGVVVVDWILRTEAAGEVGVVYASRRLSGRIDPDAPWRAFTAEDAEIIGIQTAAHILEAAAVREAIADARDLAVFDRAPSPRARPAAGTGTESAAGATSAPPGPAPRPPAGASASASAPVAAPLPRPRRD